MDDSGNSTAYLDLDARETMRRRQLMTTHVRPQLLHESGGHQHHSTWAPEVMPIYTNSSPSYGSPGPLYYQTTYLSSTQATTNRPPASTMFMFHGGMTAPNYVHLGPEGPFPPLQETSLFHASGAQTAGDNLHSAKHVDQSMPVANGLVAPDNGTDHATCSTFDGVAGMFSRPSQTSYEVYNQRRSDEQHQDLSQWSHSQMRNFTPTPIHTSPLVKCPVPKCQGNFKPDQKSVVEHFRSHPDMAVCPWPYCSSRVHNIAQHALDKHCRLRYFCPHCFDTGFTSERSSQRHCRQCTGQSLDPAHGVICAWCMLQWMNEHDFALHARYCVGPPMANTSSRRRSGNT